MVTLVAVVKKADKYRNSEFANLSLEALQDRLKLATTSALGIPASERDVAAGNAWTVKLIQLTLEIGIRSMDKSMIEDALDEIESDYSDDFFKFCA